MRNTEQVFLLIDLPDFVLRSYSKSELAHLYLSHVPVRSALRAWNAWVHLHPTLLSELYRTGYQRKNKILSTAQVQLVVEALGRL